MGQQQLLLVVVGIIVVGLAVYAGINLFRVNAIESKRNIITNELVNLAAMAQKYCLTPISLGGGNREFTGWKIPAELVTTAAGSYTATVLKDSVIIEGNGNEIVTNNDVLKVQISVSPYSYKVTIIN